MNEEQLIGNLVDHLLDNYEVHLPPLKKVKETKWYEINCFYLGEYIEIYEPDILTALKKWEKAIKKAKNNSSI